MDPIEQAVEVLKKGGVVVYPTDTAYGMAVDATNVLAVTRLYQLKGRDFKKPIHVIFPNTRWMNKIVKLDKVSLKLMNKFLPGPLTIVLPLKAKGRSWQMLSAKTKTMGVRLPDHDAAVELAKKLGKPITTTSANISNMPTCYSVMEVKKQFEKSKFKPDLYLNGGKLEKLKPSTIVSVIKGHVKILRMGPVSEKQIKEAIK